MEKSITQKDLKRNLIKKIRVKIKKKLITGKTKILIENSFNKKKNK
jgi:hypothetical protein